MVIDRKFCYLSGFVEGVHKKSLGDGMGAHVMARIFRRSPLLRLWITRVDLWASERLYVKSSGWLDSPPIDEKLYICWKDRKNVIGLIEKPFFSWFSLIGFLADYHKCGENVYLSWASHINQQTFLSFFVFLASSQPVCVSNLNYFTSNLWFQTQVSFKYERTSEKHVTNFHLIYYCIVTR